MGNGAPSEQTPRPRFKCSASSWLSFLDADIQVRSDLICSRSPGRCSPTEPRITWSDVSFQVFNFNFPFLNLIPSFLHFAPREAISRPDIQKELTLPSQIRLLCKARQRHRSHSSGRILAPLHPSSIRDASWAGDPSPRF